MNRITSATILMLFMMSAAILTPSCSPAQKEGIVRLNNEEFAAKLNQQGYILLDVRTPEEFETSRLEGAILINVLESSTFLEKIKELDKGKKVLVYCRSGNRSMTAAGLLRDQGFQEIYELRNGIKGWTGPVISGKNQ
jgi:rhodanese-related sulfurtransferase